jgi:hypothetical protein
MLAAALAVAGPLRAAEPAEAIRLYALDCGHASFKDSGFFSDTGEYDGKPGAVAVPCFLVRHPKGTLLWDTGLSDKIAESPNGVEHEGIRMSLARTLASQLKELGLSAGDVTYLAFSHLHFDHTSNANAFASSTWIMNGSDLKWALGTPTPFGVDPASFSAYSKAKTQMIEGDHDVFGDRTVRILNRAHTQDARAHAWTSGPAASTEEVWHGHPVGRSLPPAGQPQVPPHPDVQLLACRDAGLDRPHREDHQEQEGAVRRAARPERFRRASQVPGLSRISLTRRQLGPKMGTWCYCSRRDVLPERK